ncbi:MAG TPA: restriction endonuclease subunit S [Candidatus Acidoferrales bacterium]|nr:restriction endonuclease subunit S [Candidatus Acidoferrales bacterium]
MSAAFKYIDPAALPEEWTADHFGNLVDFNLGRTPPRGSPIYWNDGKYPWVSISDMTPNGLITDTAEKVSQQAYDSIFRGKLVPEGSLLMSFKLTIGRMSRLGIPAFHNEAIISFQPSPEEISPEYLSYYLSQINYKYYQDTAIKGQTLNKGKLNSLEIALPPLPEQKKIAHVLSMVQRAIEAQERIIQTTTELKKALMHKLFTEGLRNEPQKQTEIGPIPESWEVAPLSSCAVVQTGIAKGRKIDPKDAVELPYLRVANVQDGYLDLTEMKTITIRKDEEARYALHEGDVVLTEGGDFDKLGRGFIWHGQVDRCVHQNHVFAVRPDTKRISSEFFAYQSQSPYGKAYFLSVAHKTTNLACINTTKLKAFPVLLPSQEQQKDIVDACQSIDGKIASARAKHSALQDLFRTLLHELMTAKTRVHKLELSA